MNFNAFAMKTRARVRERTMNHDPSLKMNPLLAPWTGPFEAPPFDRIKPCHFVEAFEMALGLAQAEIAGIAANPEQPSFENTIVALERSGRLLKRISSGFFNVATSDTNNE